MPARQPKHARLCLTDGSCIRLRPEHPNHVWSYDFVEDRTHDGRKFRMLNVIDEFTRECLAIRVGRRLRSTDVIDVLSDLFILRGVRAGPHPVRQRPGVHRPGCAGLDCRGWRPHSVYRAGQPLGERLLRELHAKLRDELLDGEIFYSLGEARVVIEGWRRHDNAVRPHSSLGYRPPAPEAVVPSARPPAQPRPAAAGALTMADTPHMNEQSNRTTDVGQANDLSSDLASVDGSVATPAPWRYPGSVDFVGEH